MVFALVVSFDHQWVIDTTFIFQLRTCALTHLPSLVNLCKVHAEFF